jgi:hypothetical protein
MGDGLDEALNQLTAVSDPNPDQEILLISDGKENRSLYIADVQPDLVANGIPVHALGLGYSYGINETKLIDLATATGGSYRITSDDILFRKYFLEILAEAADWSVIVDPISYAGIRPSYVEVPVGEYDTKVIVTAFWEGTNADNGLQLTLISPSGKEINPETLNAKIKYVEHPRYAFYQMEFPLAGDLSSEHSGIWHAKTRKSPTAGTVRYSVEAMAVSPLRLDLELNSQLFFTGREIPLKAVLAYKEKPITESKVVIYTDIPVMNIDNLLYHEQIDIDNTDWDGKGDPPSVVDQKIGILKKMYGEKLFATQTVETYLYDDGQHGDGKPRDGIYGGSLKETTMPGPYAFRCVASDIRIDSSEVLVTRESTTSSFNQVNITPDSSIIETELYTEKNQTILKLFIVPGDKFKNYLGPGHEVKAEVVYAKSGRVVPLNDNANGTYTAHILLTKEEVMYSAQVIISIDGKEFTVIKPFEKQ